MLGRTKVLLRGKKPWTLYYCLLPQITLDYCTFTTQCQQTFNDCSTTLAAMNKPHFLISSKDYRVTKCSVTGPITQGTACTLAKLKCPLTMNSSHIFSQYSCDIERFSWSGNLFPITLWRHPAETVGITGSLASQLSRLQMHIPNLEANMPFPSRTLLHTPLLIKPHGLARLSYWPCAATAGIFEQNAGFR